MRLHDERAERRQIEWENSSPECPGCGYDDKCRCGEQIRAYLVEHHWKADGPTAYVKDELRVELQGRDGYAWQLQEFTDGDIDGVATGRWRDMDYDGYDRLSLVQSLHKLEMQASERMSDARAKWGANLPNGGTQHTTGSRANDWEDSDAE